MSPFGRRRAALDDDGAVAIVVALFAVVLFGFTSLVVDIGNAQSVRTRAQAAVDAAALAGAQELFAYVEAGRPLPDPQLAATVHDSVAANLGGNWGPDWSSCTATPPGGLQAVDGEPCIFYDATGLGADNREVVDVQLPRLGVPLAFAGMFGVGSVSIAPSAQAAAGAPRCQPCEPKLAADGQPIPPLPDVGALPAPIPAGLTLPAGELDADGCPGPGHYSLQPIVLSQSCSLQAGMYFFGRGSNLTVPATMKLNTEAGDSGVTLVFDGTALIVDGSLNLVATATGQAPSNQQSPEIPGVALVFTGRRTLGFDLGQDFFIKGDLYSFPNAATWTTRPGECGATASCELDDGVLAVSSTDFADGVPYVGDDHPSLPQVYLTK